LKSLLADPKTLLALIVAVLAGIGILFYAFSARLPIRKKPNVSDACT